MPAKLLVFSAEAWIRACEEKWIRDHYDDWLRQLPKRSAASRKVPVLRLVKANEGE